MGGCCSGPPPFAGDADPVGQSAELRKILIGGADGAGSPPSSLDLARIALSNPAFADRAIVSEIVMGIADDVDAPRGSFLCAPHSGAWHGGGMVLGRSPGWPPGSPARAG